MPDVVVYPSCNEDVSKLAGVRDAVRGVGGEIYWKAEANLAGHRQSGNARIEITDEPLTSISGKTYGHWGITVSMIDEKSARQGGPGALAIEAGHYVRGANGTRTYVPGLHILGRAAGVGGG